MSTLQQQLSRLVYSTDQGEVCPQCRQSKAACCCEAQAEAAYLASLDGKVRVRREVAGRKGKAVTTISGLPVSSAELKALSLALKKACGSGGAVKDRVIEIQGDHRDRVIQALLKLGYNAVQAGG